MYWQRGLLNHQARAWWLLERAPVVLLQLFTLNHKPPTSCSSCSSSQQTINHEPFTSPGTLSYLFNTFKPGMKFSDVILDAKVAL